TTNDTKSRRETGRRAFSVYLSNIALLRNRSAVAVLPIQITRNSDQHNGSPPECLIGTSNDRVKGPSCADQDIEPGQPGIARAPVWTRNLRPFPPQPEQCDHSQRVGEHHPVNDVGVKLIVSPAQRERRRPDALPDQAKGWCSPLRMNFRHALEK